MSKPEIQFAVQTNDAEKKFRVIAMVKVPTRELKKSKLRNATIGLGIQHRRIHELDAEIRRLKGLGYREEYFRTVNLKD
jgi:hypothetical protein